MEFKTPYDGKRHRVSLSFLDEEGEQKTGLTEQHHKKDCDINHILRTYDKTGLITHVNTAQAHYGDFTIVNEYQESLNLVMAAQEDFLAMPADIRKKFDNDPGQFMEFVTNPDNLDEMRELGLAVKAAPEKVQKVEVINPTQSDA